jgi:serine/threonine protein kinase
MNHLDACPHCRRRVAELPEDSFARKVRAARDLEGTPAPPDSAWRAALNGEEGTPSPARPASSPSGVPPELAGLRGYEFVKKLGEGGMGVVYLARNTVMDRQEVLKVMNKAIVGRPEAIERFLQEIRSAAQLIHTNIATAFSVHPHNDLLILAMEYVEGSDLAKVLRERGPLPVAYACYCIYQAALGLQRGHDMGLVHRDIKPGNLLLSRQGKQPIVKIVDFGLAKAKTEMPVERELTGTNQMMGTPGYSAPEQLRDARSADIRSDIYSLGCSLYALLAGSGPFKGNSAYEILIAQQTGTMKPLREVRPEVPEELAAVVARMMAADPADRFQLPKDVAAALVPFVKKTKETTVNHNSNRNAIASAETMQPGAAPSRQTRDDLGSGVPANPWSKIVATEQVPADHRIASKTIIAGPSSLSGGWRRWLPAFVLVALLIGIAGVLSAQMIRVKTANGIIVIKNAPADSIVSVDGETVTVSHDGETLTVTSIAAGKHEVRVTVGDVVLKTSDVTIKLGGEPVQIYVDPPAANAKAGQPKQISGPEDKASPAPPQAQPAVVRVKSEYPGNWEIQGDELVQTDARVSVAILLFGDPNWTDYEFEVDALRETPLVTGQVFYSLLLRSTDDKNTYRVPVASTGVGINLWQNGELTSLGQMIPYETADNKWYRIKVTAQGSDFVVYGNNVKVFEGSNDVFSNGKVGLQTCSAVCRFKNIKVKAAGGEVLFSGLPGMK